MRGDHAAVIFDLDGLLVDSEPLYKRAWQAAASDLGFALGDAEYDSWLGLTEAGYEAEIVRLFGRDFPLDVFRDRWRRRWSGFVEAGELNAKPGARSLLAALDDARVPMALATSSTRDRTRQSIESAELVGYLDPVVVLDDVSRGKPAPDLFLMAATRLGVAPGDCLVLEDSAVGAEAALAAEMSVIVVPDPLRPRENLSRPVHLVADSLEAAHPTSCVRCGPADSDGRACRNSNTSPF